ncbi:MAG: zinc-dependent metalloprotease, partial [Bradymonadia bacterium]
MEFLNESPLSDEKYTELDCEPAVYDQFGRFGFFRAERFRYDRQVGGGHDENREFHASHHNIWRDPFYVNADGEKVSKPFSQRTPKPIVYYLNVGFPEDLKDVAGQMSTDWDAAFFGAVVAATGKSNEAVRDMVRGSSAGAADWMYLPGDEHKQSGMFQIRENNCSFKGLQAYLSFNPKFASVLDRFVDESLEPGEKITAGLVGSERLVKASQLRSVCGHLRQLSSRDETVQRFDWQQMGDVRFSMLNWINEHQPSGPLGYGPSSVDKETGQIIAGSANMYGAAVDRSASSAADIIRAMNEDLDYATLVSGASYADWFDAGTSFGEMSYEMTDEMSQELRSRVEDFDLVEAYGDYHFEDGRVDAVKVMAQADARLSNPLPGDPMYAPSRIPVDEASSRLEALKADPFVQSRLIGPNMEALVRQMQGLDHDAPLTAEARKMAMDLQTNPLNFKKYDEEKFKFFSEQNMYHQDFIDDSVIGQALALKGEDPEVVYQTLRRAIFRAVALHEIGHTVGMTHNFEASRDALNYPDEFWQIRHDHESDEARRENRLPEYRYASIMDYGSRFNSDTKGLGKYDHAAIKFGYGHITEKFSDDLVVNPSFSYRRFVDGYEVIPELLEDGDGDPSNNYLNITKRDDMPIERAVNDLRNGLAQNAQRLLENPNRSLGDYWRSNEVPYGYCFDVFRGNLDCQVWDE